jgi:acyl carrier protein
MTATNLTREQLTDSVIDLIRPLCVTDKEIRASTSLAEDIDIDSLTMVRLDIAIQSTLGIALPVERVEGIVTISDLVDALIEHGEPVEALDE